MNPHRVSHARYGYLKVALVVLPLIALAILANNEYTDQRVREVARESAELSNAKTAALSLRFAVKQRDQNLAACERGNGLRRKINVQARVQTKFLKIARTARLRAVQTADNPVDRKINQDAADQYSELIEAQATVPIVDCASRFPDPTKDPPKRGPE